MKKRFISLLLTVLMILSLFSGLSVNAYAATTAYGANVIEYTMGQGDYVLRICQKLGLNYYTCKDAIMILNNIYDGQWSKLAVGRVLTLPASDNDAVLIANGARTTTYNTGAAATTASTGTITGTATTGTVSTASTANFTSAKSADTLAYYLVPYTMSYGETVSGVCNNLGVNFSIFNPFIKQVNNISDWSKVRAGDTIIVPTPVCPVVGTTCYGVMQHVVAGSDTAYGIVSSKGVSYNANELLLKALNQTDNLAAIRAGSNFFYPVPLTVSVPGTGNPGSTATTTTVTTVTDGNGTTTTSTTSTSKLYTLTSGMSASDGTMLFYVNNQAVTAAPAGAKVTIVTQTYSGRAIQSLAVKYTDGTADLHLTSDTFVMPSCNVRVDAAIKTGHDINISANYSGKAAASVGGVSVSSAVKGSAVVIKSTDPNYEISAVYAYYKKMITASTKTALTVSSSRAFIMPDADVDVEVVLTPVSTYSFYVIEPTPARGSFYLQVNGNAVTRAAKGASVTVVAKAMDGYEPVELTVNKHGDPTKFVNVFSNTFTMPAFDVDVSVRFGAKGNNILIMPSQIGNIYAFDDPSDISNPVDEDLVITDQDTNEVVILAPYDEDGNEITSGYKVEYDVVRNSDGLKVSVTAGANLRGRFKMPKGGVTVTPIITAATPAIINGEIFMNRETTPATSYRDCSFSVTYKEGGKEKRVEFTGKNDKSASIPVLEYVDLRTTVADGVAFVQYKIKPTYSSEPTAAELAEIAQLIEQMQNEANTYGYFQIPDTDGKVAEYTIEAYFETGKVAMGPAAITGTGSVGYKILDANGNWKSSNTCEPGAQVMIVVTNGNGYKFDASKLDSKLIVTRKDNGARVTVDYISVPSLDPNSYAFTFTMPASGVNVQAIFDPKPFVITMKCVDEVGNDLTGLGLWQIAIDWVPGVLDNATNVNWYDFETKFDVSYGDYVTVAMTEAGWSKYDMVSFRIDDQQYTADQLNYFYNFQMIDDRACDHVITAVLRPKTVSAIHNLNAMYDVTKAGVEFMIISSPSGYSDEFRRSPNVDGAPLKYVNKAIAGDKVAIVANSIDSKYTVKASDITIIPFGTDADRIVPTEEWIYANGVSAAPYADGAIRVFTFTMPDCDMSITLNFSGTQQGMVISVYDADNKPVAGMVRVFANNVYRDVGTDFNFADIAYKTPVQILRSELALAENKVIRDVEISTGSGKSVPYTDMTNAGEGIQFTMPDEPVWVIIRIDDRYYPNVPTVVITTQVNNGGFVFRRSADPADPVLDLEEFAPGEIVYVFDEPDNGYDHLGLGDLKIYVNGVQNTVNVQQVDSGSSDGRPHIWSFTMPQGTIIIKADFPKAEALTVDLSIDVMDKDGTSFPDGKVYATVGGNVVEITGSGHIKALTGQSVTITSAMNGYDILRVLSQSGKGDIGTGNVYVVPEDIITDQLYVGLKSTSNKITNDVSGGTLSYSLNPTMDPLTTEYVIGSPLYIMGTAAEGYELPDAADIFAADVNGTRVTVSDYTPGAGELADYVVIPTEGGGIYFSTAFDTASRSVSFMVKPDGASAKLTMGSLSTEISGTQTYNMIEPGTIITIESATEGFDQISLNADIGTINGNKYMVPNGDAHVLINLTSSKNPITKGTYSHGNMQFADDKDMKNLYAGAADTDDEVYILDLPDKGYNALKKEDLKITRITDNSLVELTELTPDATHPARWMFKMPAGGVKVNATFTIDAFTVTFSILDANNGNAPLPDVPVSVSVNGAAATTVTHGQSISASIGQKLTFTAPSGYKILDNTGYTVNGNASIALALQATT